jgi:hypothetical protein
MSRAIAFTSWFHNAIAYRVPDERGGRRELELVHDGGTMRSDGFDTDLQQAGDLLVGITLGNG